MASARRLTDHSTWGVIGACTVPGPLALPPASFAGQELADSQDKLLTLLACARGAIRDAQPREAAAGARLLVVAGPSHPAIFRRASRIAALLACSAIDVVEDEAAGTAILRDHLTTARSPLVVCVSTDPGHWQARVIALVAADRAMGRPGDELAAWMTQRHRAGAQEASPPFLLALAARTTAELVERAQRLQRGLAANVSHKGATLVAATRAFSRGPLRVAWVLGSADAAEQAVASVLDGTARVSEGPEARPTVAFLFSGQGSQSVGMARELFQSNRVFRDSLERCHEVVRRVLEVGPIDLLYGEPDRDALLDQARYAQPLLLSLQWSLTKVWESVGVVPDYVVGHSSGEYGAACAAGLMAIDETLALVAERGRLLDGLERKGTTAVVFCERERIAEILGSTSFANINIAAINGESNITISGDVTRVDEAIHVLQAAGVRCERIRMRFASHSALLDPCLDAFETAAARCRYSEALAPLVSNIDAEPRTRIDAKYWRTHLREPVQFSKCMERLARLGARVFVEIGPHSSLLSLGRGCVDIPGAAWVSSLKRNSNAAMHFAASAGEVWRRGAAGAIERFSEAVALGGLPVPLRGDRDELADSEADTPGRVKLPGERFMVAPVSLVDVMCATAASGAGTILRDVTFGAPLVLDGEVDQHLEPSPSGVGLDVRLVVGTRESRRAEKAICALRSGENTVVTTRSHKARIAVTSLGSRAAASFIDRLDWDAVTRALATAAAVPGEVVLDIRRITWVRATRLPERTEAIELAWDIAENADPNSVELRLDLRFVTAEDAAQLDLRGIEGALVPSETVAGAASGYAEARSRLDALHKRLTAVTLEAPARRGVDLVASMVEAVREVAGDVSVTADTVLANVGLDSLALVQLASRLSRLTHTRVAWENLFDPVSLAVLAERLSSTNKSALPPIVALRNESRSRLSLGQERTLIATLRDPETAAYNIANVMLIDGTIATATLESAFRAVVGRHESLRTTFDWSSGEPHPVLRHDGEVDFAAFDVPDGDVVDESTLVEYAYEDAAEAYALDTGPLVRLRLYSLSQTRHVLLLAAHHTVWDATSSALVRRELAAAYDAIAAGNSPALGIAPLAYRDFALWQRAFIELPWLRQSVIAVAERLKGAPVATPLPSDRPRRPGPGKTTQIATYDFDPELTTALSAAGRAHGATAFMAFLTVFFRALQRFSSSHDLCVGVPIANRHIPNSETIVGPLVNTIVMRANVDAAASPVATLAHVREVALAAYEHQSVPIELVVEALAPPRTTLHTPVYQVLFNLLPDMGTVETKTFRGQVISMDAGGGDLDLHVWILRVGDRYTLNMKYADIFDRTTIDRLATLFMDEARALLRASNVS